VLITGKFSEAARRRKGQKYQFDAVVVDACRQDACIISSMSRLPCSAVAPTGNVRAHAARIAAVITSSRTRVHFAVNDDDAAVSGNA
jgi:hypothetical protein